MRVEEVKRCQLHHWYPQFTPNTIKTISIQLPQWFIHYLHQDSLIIPSQIHSPPTDLTLPWNTCFVQQINNAIQKLGGRVVTKLNWSVPKDATWIMFGETLACENLTEILMLLKASDYIVHDLTRPFEDCSDWDGKEEPDEFYLNLRKLSNLYPSREFRAFVKDREIAAISQRDHLHYYSHLEQQKDDLQDAILEFFDRVIRDSDLLQDVPDIVVDVYVDKSMRVWIIDFNPFGMTCEPLLFSWEELYDDINGIDFRLFPKEREGHVQPKSSLIHRLPKDIIDLSTKEGIENFAELARSGELDSMYENEEA